MVNIYLTGPYGCGKSSTGKELAKLLGYVFIDPDALFVKKHGDIGAFIHVKGWRALMIESSHILRSIGAGNHVIPQPLFGKPEFDDIKEADAKFCQSNGILILLLPAKSITESANICFAREKARGYEVKLSEVLERQKHSISLYKKFAQMTIYDAESPTSAAIKIKLELERRKII